MQILILIAGLILKLACPDHMNGFNLDMIGLILIWVGGLATGIPFLLVIAGWLGFRSTSRSMKRRF